MIESWILGNVMSNKRIVLRIRGLMKLLMLFSLLALYWINIRVVLRALGLLQLTIIELLFNMVLMCKRGLFLWIHTS